MSVGRFCVKRLQLEHLLRAAGGIAGQDRVIVIGSQSILGARPDAPEALLLSMEADFIFPDNPALSDVVDGSIGEGSIFHETHGYYAQGVDFTTAILPAGWQQRLHEVKSPNTRGTTGLCLDPADLIASKYAAGREKDYEFIRVAFQHGIVTAAQAIERVSILPLDAARIASMLEKIGRDAKLAR